MATTAPFGSWQSSITADMLVARTIRIFDVKLVDNQVYWVEMRPEEGGRHALMRRTVSGKPKELTPQPYNVRTRVHEYGGNAFGVWDNEVIFTDFQDQSLHLCSKGTVDSLLPPNPCRYADFAVDPASRRVYAVREDHSVPNTEATNTLVLLDLANPGSEAVIAAGHDFYSSPCLHPDRNQLAWLAWNHPAMPWDETELWTADLDENGEVIESRCVWAEPGMSLFQPAWSPQGALHCVSDVSGWWNLYRMEAEGPQALCPMEAEFGSPQWVFGLSTYGFIDERHILCTIKERGTGSLAILDGETGSLEPLESEYTSFTYLQTNGTWAAFLGASPTEFASLVLLNLETKATRVLRRSNLAKVDPQEISRPQAIVFPTEGDQEAHAYFYPPQNARYEAPEGELPPLRVESHGGPTSATQGTLDLGIQYWTSRGFAVVDVNYGGSTGYGTAYRRRLNGQWGIVDVQDCTNAARHLVNEGLVDPERLSISGGSAGGYTTLACLAFTDQFHAGISHFGVSDLGALARETHKFESRYLDSLIGPYPEEEELYNQRSPLHSAHTIACPVLFLQGLEDKIVLPNQAEMMVEALRGRGIPVAYLPFEGEQHGFRQAQNIKAAIWAETYFLAQLFRFEPADDIPVLKIENWP